tara:strand:+ start:351 stop:578 length:228 start_codon:yes stop_codon:yes gene_type:complete
MAQMKAIQLDYQELLDQLTIVQKNDILIFMLMELNMWNNNNDVQERIKGHSGMLLEMMIYNINKKIAMNNIGEEQ